MEDFANNPLSIFYLLVVGAHNWNMSKTTKVFPLQFQIVGSHKNHHWLTDNKLPTEFSYSYFLRFHVPTKDELEWYHQNQLIMNKIFHQRFRLSEGLVMAFLFIFFHHNRNSYPFLSVSQQWHDGFLVWWLGSPYFPLEVSLYKNPKAHWKSWLDYNSYHQYASCHPNLEQTWYLIQLHLSEIVYSIHLGHWVNLKGWKVQLIFLQSHVQQLWDSNSIHRILVQKYNNQDRDSGA